MGNSKNSKARKNRKVSNKSQCLNTTDQKENVPKNQKSKLTKSKPNPNDSIAMSKQLLRKKTNVRSKRQSSNENRVCGNGKPIPSLAELEKMFEDSDEDDQSPKTPVKETCTSPSPQKMSLEKDIPESLNETKLLSPKTINQISEKLLDMISNISNPIELLDNAPPPPIIPPKKRKKPDEPYIVGCKDRPQVIRKPNANFCKGDEDYGVQESGDPAEPPTKRAKPSKIPNYSKSIFNAKSDEIAARLAKDETEVLSDTSLDSNKAIKTLTCRNLGPHKFSPIPSTSKDNEAFIKNDKLFNDSLREDNINEDVTPIKKENEVQIIDTPYETIVIDDVADKHKPIEIENTNKVNNTDIQIEKSIVSKEVELDDDIEICETNNDDDCVMVLSSTQANNHNNYNQPIDIDDEYSNINIENITLDQEVIEVIDIDDVIAENKSILDKWKNNREQLDKVNTVVDVPNTYQNSKTPQTSAVAPHEQHLTNVNLTTDSCHNSIPDTRNRNYIGNIVTNFFKKYDSAQRTKKKTNSISKHSQTSLVSVCTAVLNVMRGLPLNIRCQQRSSRPTTTIDLDLETSTISPSRADHTNLDASSEGSFRCGTSSDQNTQATTISKTSALQAALPSSPQVPEAARNFGECPICMDSLSGQGIASTICGHVFCLKCIQAAIKANGKRCPTCRKILKGPGGGYHQLFL